MVMGAMMIFFGFFTGAATAELILREDERGTLSRLFTTPTRTGTILAGKLIAVALTLIGQVAFLMLFGWLVFRIYWGELLPAFLAGLGLVILAGTFGVFLVSLLKNTRQGSVVFGGVMTITGMLGVINMFTMGAPNANPMADKISLLVPQGWAMRSLSLAMDGASIGEMLPWFGGRSIVERGLFHHWQPAPQAAVCVSTGGEIAMNKILDITRKDLLQMLRDWKFLFFLLVMPAGFTLLMGFIFGGADQAEADRAILVAVIDQDHSVHQC